ncbi:MAG: hypothetical protein J6Y37_10050 [Paludibacteraceae bacterium]|nr:hypothetical protein [Paludibacteraceae bacterium]
MGKIAIVVLLLFGIYVSAWGQIQPCISTKEEAKKFLAKEYKIFSISIYPKGNYPIWFLCIKDGNDCVPIMQLKDTEKLIDWFKKNTFIVADPFQIDDYRREVMQKDSILAASIIREMDFNFELRHDFKTIEFLLDDESLVEVSVAVINSDFVKATDIGTTSIGIDSDYFFVPYNFKYIRKLARPVESLFCGDL